MTSWRLASVPPLLLAGCSFQRPASTPALVARDAHQAYEAREPTAAALPACARMGPFSCDFEPSSSEDLCVQLAKCLGRHDPAKANIQVAGCGELGSFETAPESSGIKRVAVVNVDGSLDGESGQGSYLVAEREGGFCIVDQAVHWTALPDGYLDTDSRLAWREDQGKTLLSVRTQALRFNDDEDEDGANVRGALCRDAEYALDGGRFVAVRERAVNEPCDDDD
ncbi:MAG TPA: hypothetical protein VFX59_12350 [Polyangiales bacterium]|nr:hypothetical protein [Polyangiales bacterium]